MNKSLLAAALIARRTFDAAGQPLLNSEMLNAVLIMVLVTAFFFVIVDTVLGHGMQALLKLAT